MKNLVAVAVAFPILTVLAGPKPILDHVLAPRQAIDLCSETEWRFARDVPPGTPFDSPALKWQVMPVPSHVFWNFKSGKAAYYRRTFALTEAEAAKNARLFFELMSDTSDIFVNGRKVLHIMEPSQPFWADVTGVLKPGMNMLEIALSYKDYKGVGNDRPMTHGWLWGQFTGITLPVHLELTDKVWIRDVAVRPEVDCEKPPVFRAQVIVRNDTDRAVTTELSGGVVPVGVAHEGAVELPTETLNLAAHACATVMVERTCPAAKPWNPDSPNLYYADFRLGKGDARRTRFGFRELSIRGHQTFLNGYPFINRRDTTSLSDWRFTGCSEKAMRDRVKLFKSRGIVSIRSEIFTLYRQLRVADEEGLLVSVLAATGGPYGRTEKYWPECRGMFTRMVENFKNSPALIYWGLFNEFGSCYTRHSRTQSPKMAELGEYVMRLDPTRWWCSHGDGEVNADPIWGKGPCPVRSLHYPINFGWGTLPGDAYWFDSPGGVGWQGTRKAGKPVMISEDLYHGMLDSFTVMSKWGNEAVYENEGYVRAWREAIAMLAEGYYYTGISEWNPWYMSLPDVNNRLFADGPILPDYVLATRYNWRNVFAGEDFSVPLFAYNALFTPQDAVLERVDRMNGRELTRESVKFRLLPGIPWESQLKFTAPRVEKPGRYEVDCRLSAGGKELVKRTFAYNILPRLDGLPKACALFDRSPATNVSPVRAVMPSGRVFDSAKEAVVSGAKVVIVTGAPDAKDGEVLSAFVARGGCVLRLVDEQKAGWAPVGVKKSVHAIAFRRDPSFLADLDESVFRVWRGDSLVSSLALSRTAKDSDILVDSADASGLNQADVVRLFRGDKGGTWLVTTLPLEARLKSEPAAGHLLQRLVEEGLSGKASRTGTYGFLGAHPYEAAFRLNEMASPVEAKRADVLFVDGLRPLKASAADRVRQLAERGKTVIVTEVSVTNRPFLSALGLDIRPEGAIFINRVAHDIDPFGLRYDKEGLEKLGELKTYASDAKKGLSDSEKKAIERELMNAGKVRCLVDGTKEADYFKAREEEWRGANRDWFLPVAGAAALRGLTATQFYFSKIDMANYNRWSNQGRPLANMNTYAGHKSFTFGEFVLDGNAKARPLLAPCAMCEISCGKGRIILSALKLGSIRTIRPQSFCDIWGRILGNLGVKTLLHETTATYRVAGCSAREPLMGEKALPGDGWDLRYFPVNRSGWSLEARNYCPVEQLPKEPIPFAGIPFAVTDKGCKGMAMTSLGGGKETVRCPRVWVLAACTEEPKNAEMKSGRKPVVIARFINNTDDWRTKASNAYYGKDIGAVDIPMDVTRGRVAWDGPLATGEGPTTKTKPGRLYVFSIDNPWDASIPVSAVYVGDWNLPLMVLGVTWEVE